MHITSYYFEIKDLIPFIPELKSVDIPVPLINSLTNWFAFCKAYTEPINKNLLNIVEEFSFKIAKGNKRIKATIICTNNKEIKLLSQLLKNPEVFLLSRQRNAKGERRISILANIYLNVNVITKLREEIESILVRIPSIENILKFVEEFPLSSFIKEEKEIFLLKIVFPKPHMNSDISQEKEIILEHIESEKFIKIQMKMARITNLYGDSTSCPL